jgi:hypothetical protein
MKRIFAAAMLIAAVATSAAAQTSGANPVPVPGTSVTAMAPAPGPAIGTGQIGAPTYVVPPANVTEQGGGVINIGQAFGTAVQPYIDAAVNAIILAFVGWLGVILKNKFNISIDQGHRDALVTALQNQAGSLIADGVVKMEGAKITVPDKALAQSANEIMSVIPDAAKRLGFTPDYLQKRILDTIPQTAAGAAMVAAAVPAPAAPAPVPKAA